MKRINIRSTARLAAFAALSAVTFTACSSDDAVAPTPTAPKGIIVLDGFIQPGLTLLGDTGTATTRLAFGPSTEFDAAVLTYERDTVVSVSSRLAGDLLYIADVRAGTVRKVQLPAGGNASRARLTTGGNGSARVIVALPDSQMVVYMTIPASGSPTVERVLNAGQCPADAFRFDNATWVVDANANCRTDYSAIGSTRLIRIPDGGGSRDTVNLPSLRGSGVSSEVRNGVVTVANGGDADFSAFPYTLRSAAAIASVDLRSRQLLQQRTLLQAGYGASLRRGLDNYLYVALYEDLGSFTQRVIQLNDNLTTSTESPVSSQGWRLLLDESDDEVACGSATADALGRLHCISNGAGSATSLHVFDKQGKEVRRVGAGQGGVDMAIRP